MGHKRKPVGDIYESGIAGEPIDIEGVDPNVRDILEALWDAGYPTRSSCEGGAGHPSRAGWVVIDMNLTRSDAREIKDIVRRFTNTPIRVSKDGFIMFEGPISEPYGVEDLASGEWPDDCREFLWYKSFGERMGFPIREEFKGDVYKEEEREWVG